MKRFLIAAGGTGGHVFPAMAVADRLWAMGHHTDIVTDGRAFHWWQKWQDKANIHVIEGGGVSKGRVIARITGLWKLFISFFKCLSLVKGADYALGFGGYITVPVLLAAWIKGKKTFVHEQNAVMGLANRLLQKTAHETMTGYPLNRGIHTGTPVREDILNIPPYEPPKKTINVLVIGGSQGAKAFDEILPRALEKLPAKLREKINIRQQAHDNPYQTINAETAPFFDDMAACYTTAHLVIARAGAGTVAEIMACHRPTLFIPYPYAADNHQHKNAEYLVDNNAAWMVDETDEEGLYACLEGIFSDLSSLGKVAETLKGMGGENATHQVVERILS